MPAARSLLLLVALLAACSPSGAGVDFDRDGVPDVDDCAPEEPSVHPGASDPYGDGVDSDCDGFDGIDRDGDGAPVLDAEDEPFDCNDNDAGVYPGAPDSVDGVDRDCDGIDGVDADGDGLAAGPDCDDSAATTSPFHPELCGDGVDNDCSGQADDADEDLDGAQAEACGGRDCDDARADISPLLPELCGDEVDEDCSGATDDLDGDGDGVAPAPCGGLDCDDGDPSTFPGAPEQCGDDADNDCDGAVDDRDIDGDGVLAEACGGEDCDDLSPLSQPGADELPDFADNDCDGQIDEGTVLADDDGDGLSEAEGDCDDSEPAVVPGVPELCGDGLDNDCSFAVDDLDADGDGLVAQACGGLDCDDGDPGVSPVATEVCGDAVDEDCSGAVDDLDADRDGAAPVACGGLDCDDGDGAVFPGALEACDGVDNDCSGVVDDRDIDGDGVVALSCGGDDCDDLDSFTRPGGTEIADGADNDCDGAVDEDTPASDDDGDGHCELGPCLGSALPGDCDDEDPFRAPSFVEQCNGIDDDCNALTDENSDADDDGYTTCEGDCAEAEPLAGPAGVEVAGDGFDNDCDGLADPPSARPCDATTGPTLDLQTLVDGLGAGETLCLLPGEYDARVVVDGELAIVAPGGPSVTRLRPSGMGTAVGFGSNTTRGTLLEGVTLSGASGGSTGVVIDGGAPTVRNVVIEGFSRALDASVYDPSRAGGVLSLDGDALLERVLIQGCTVTQDGLVHDERAAGGLLVRGGAVTLRGVTIQDNNALGTLGRGGGMTVDDASVDADGLELIDNFASSAGGGLHLVSGAGTFGRLLLQWNEADNEGGGGWLRAGDWTVVSGEIAENVATDGGGFSVEAGASLEVLASLFDFNRSADPGPGQPDADGAGGAILGPGAVTLRNVVLWDNEARYGSALAEVGDAELVNTVLHSNVAGDVDLFLVAGQTLWATGGPVWDSAITENDTVISDPLIGGLSVGLGPSYDTCFFWDNSAPAVFDPGATGGSDTPTGDGNVDIDPEYLDGLSGDFRLAPGSPAVDAGAGEPDPDGSPNDVGAFGGPYADRWDLDRDGYPRPWAPGGVVLDGGLVSSVHSSEPAGPEFRWRDLQSTGVDLQLGDEDHAWVPIGFDFPFAGTSHDHVSVGDNGVLAFDDVTVVHANHALPDATFPPLIAAYWDDLDPSAGGAVYSELTGDEGSRVFTVHWRQVPYWTDSGGLGAVEVQAELHEGSGDVVLRWLDVTHGLNVDNGVSATVGLQRPGTGWLQLSYDEAVVQDGTAVRLRAWDCDDADAEVHPGAGCP